MVAKFVQPDSTTQTGTTYKGSIDAAIAVLAEQAAQFAVSAQDTPNMTVAMRAGRLYLADRSIVSVAAQNSAALTAPVTNPRKDIVYLDATTGAIGVATGAEAAAPVDPAVPTNKIPKARINWTVGAAVITNSMLDDLSAVIEHDASQEFAVGNWTIKTFTTPKNVSLNGVVYYPITNSYIAVGGPDGVDAYIVAWNLGREVTTERANPKNVGLSSIDYAPGLGGGNGRLVAVGGPDGVDAYIVTSDDSGTWTERANPKNVTLNAVAWNGSLFVAVGAADGVDAYIVTSPDGITWTERANPKNFALNAVAWGNGLFVAVGAADGTDAYLVTSPDGITWTERANPENVALNGVTWAPEIGLFCAVGVARTNQESYIVTSPDGITWTVRSTGDARNRALYVVLWTGRFFLAMGSESNNNIGPMTYTSRNGVSWRFRPSTRHPTGGDVLDIAMSPFNVATVGTNDGTKAMVRESLYF